MIANPAPGRPGQTAAWFGAVLIGALAALLYSTAAQQPATAPPSFADGFRTVETRYRPRVRWWWPGAHVERNELIREVNEIADAGFGGFEIADVYDSVDAAMDPVVYGWGTKAWNDAVEVVLETARARGLVADITIGPHWPSTVPTIVPDAVAAAKEIAHGRAIVRGGDTFTGPLPEPVLAPGGVMPGNPGPPVTANLLRVLAVRCSASCAGDGTIELDAGSVQDLTASVRENRLSWTAPAGGEWVLLPIYERGTGQIVNMFAFSPKNSPVTDPQSYVVDHFSRAGAQAVIDYWEKSLLTPRIRTLLRETGGAIFEDSIELRHTQAWTPGMLQEFETRRGYALTRYLPALMNRSFETFTSEAAPAFGFADADLNARVLHDWEQTLNELWIENRLRPLTAWARSLGLKYRNQGYGSPVDVILSAALTGQPEGESLGFGDNIDHYRALASGRDIAGSGKLSDEIGAFFGGYDTPWTTKMLPTMNRDFSGGVNELFLHGYSYIDAPGVRWPGFAAFGTNFAEAWNGQQPTWQHILDLSGYMGRTQYVLQQGVNAVDVAVLRQAFDRTGGYADSKPLLRAGYSVGYQSPATLQLPNAVVNGGRLASSGPAYGALAIVNERVMTVDTAERILGFAGAGLPVVLIGELPSVVPGVRENQASSEALRRVLDRLVAQPTVVRGATVGDLPRLLAGVNVTPSVEYSSDADLLYVRRRDGETNYYYVYNHDKQPVAQEVRVTGRGTPFALNAWTGAIAPIATYAALGGRTSFTLSLQPGEAAMFAVTDRALVPRAAKNARDTTADEVRDRDSRLMVRDTSAGTYTSRLSDGAEVQTTIGTVPEPIPITAWSLEVESWEPGDTSTAIVKRRLPQTQVNQLQPLLDLGLADVSGVARYRATVMLDREWTGGYGAYLSLGKTMDTVRVRINGRSVGAVNQLDPVIDAGPFLKSGANLIEVEVATSLRNRLMAVRGTSAFGGRGGPPQPRGYGLLGPVVLRPYGQVEIGN